MLTNDLGFELVIPTTYVAVTDIDGLLRPGGILAKLRARGYEIDEP
jgi:hypothetical protein